MSEKMSELELERARRIAENKRRMEEMGVLEASQLLAADQRATPPAPKRPRPRLERVEVKPEDLRRTSRHRKDVNYNEHALFKGLEAVERPARRIVRVVKKGGGAGGGRVYARKAGWNPMLGYAGSAAQKRCQEAAQELIEQLPNPAMAKLMTHSMVSGGFWCNAPKGMTEVVGVDVKTNFDAYLPEGVELPPNAAHLNGSNGAAWGIVWLPRKGSAGFSGNWRGFAIDNNLYPGDVVVCELLRGERQRSPGPFNFVFHILRALDYETEGEKAARKAADGLEAGDEGEDSQAEDQQQQQQEEQQQRATPPADEAAAAAAASGGSQEEGAAEGALLRPSPPADEPAAAAAAAEAAPAATADAPAAAASKRQRHQAKLAEAADAQCPGAAAASAPGRAASKAPAAGGSGAQKASRSRKASTAAGGAKGKAAGKAAGKQQAAQEAERDEEDKEEEEEAYEVEEIRGVRGKGAKREVLIKWWGWKEEYNTWEPLKNLDEDLATYQLAPGVVV